MTLFAIVLVTFSAISHAAYNLFIKSKNPSPHSLFMTTIAASIVLLPIVLFFRERLMVIPSIVWMWIAATGAVQGAYYVFLAKTYQHGDFSHGYPLVRSLPVVLVAIASVILGRGGQIQPLAFPGFLIVAMGCLLLPVPAFSNLRLSHYRAKWVVFALLAAFCITLYTLIDDQALRILRTLGTGMMNNLEWTLVFIELEGISITFFLGVIIFLWGNERKQLLAASRKEWRRSIAVGLAIVATYSLVLFAMGYVSNVSYISAFRQLSIPIGAALGILVRKEPADIPKVIGIAAVVTGLILVALA